MVDILMATYNGEKHIAEQLDSILAQSYTNWQVIIQDDCSKDSTVDIINSYIEKYPQKFVLHKNASNTGTAGLNFLSLVQKSESDYIMFCDQDDVWKPDKIYITLKKMLELEDIHPRKPILVHTDLEVVDSNLLPISPSIFKLQHLHSEDTAINRLLVQNNITGCTMMINKSLRKALAHYPSNIVVHDWWIAVVASVFGEIGFVEQSTISYRQHPGNFCGAQDMNNTSYILGRAKNVSKAKAMLTLGYRQAYQLIKIYGKSIPADKYDIIKAYSDMLHATKLKKLSTISKYKIWKSGIIRKIGQLLYM